ncbi:N-acetyltransferase family protein [Enterovibrio baiacu]|uniref:GNAT family N-acetyltransferase n=1 Tax=Enterovibrio baiacu TaxID=2491023 RepID=UPI003D13A712
MIREMNRGDFDAFWPTFESIIQSQETYALRPDMTQEEAYAFWVTSTSKSFVYENDGEILGTYYIKPNAMGPSDHICNCGYMVSENARGRGVARELCEHSLRVAVALGFEAMQFNSVVSTNAIAVLLWEKLGFSIIGTIPKAYRHPTLGYVDCFVMHRLLV